jgi:hypothetical protein
MGRVLSSTAQEKCKVSCLDVWMVWQYYIYDITFESALLRIDCIYVRFV